MDNERLEIAARLREARDDAGFDDATHAANHFRWPVIAYRSHENGIRGLTASVAAKYAKTYGVRMEWLVSGEGPKVSLGVENELAKLPKEQMNEVLHAWQRIMKLVKITGKTTD